MKTDTISRSCVVFLLPRKVNLFQKYGEKILKMPGLCVDFAGSDSPLRSRDCKFAGCNGKDYESEVHVNLDFRIRPINCIAHALNHQFDDFRNGGRRQPFCFTVVDICLNFSKCLSVCIVSSGGIKICSKKIGEKYLAYSVRSCARSQEIFVHFA